MPHKCDKKQYGKLKLMIRMICAYFLVVIFAVALFKGGAVELFSDLFGRLSLLK